MLSDIRNTVNTGVEFNLPPNGKGVSLYNGTGGAVAIGDLVMIDYEETAGQEVSAITPATTAFNRRFAVALEAVASGAIGLFQTEGMVEAFVAGSSVSAGDSLKVTNGLNELVKDSTARTSKSIAVAIDAQATAGNVLVTVFLHGEGNIV